MMEPDQDPTDPRWVDIRRRLAMLPREARPPRDLLPAIRARVQPARRVLHWPWALAAGLVGLLLGVGAGRASAARSITPAPTEPVAMAAEVQRTGTAWVSALARLGTVPPSSEPLDARQQGSEAALSVLYGAALAWAELTGDTPASRDVLQAIANARRALTPPALRPDAVPF